ncbi:MAG: hypothetical protein V4617_07760 [Gemmatimonadota bacterium]
MLAAALTGVLLVREAPAQSTPTKAARDTAFLDSLLRAHRYPIRLERGGLAGPGATLLLAAAQSSQFFMLGESHNVAEIPRFAAALFDTLHSLRGFTYYATENGAEIIRLAGSRAIRDHEDGIFALGRRYPHAFQFWNDQELDALIRISRRATGRGNHLWGLDQEYGALHILDRLIAIAPSKAARALARQLADSVRRIESSRPFQGELRERWIDSADSARWPALRAAFRPIRGSEAARLIDALAFSSGLYKYNARGAEDNTWYFRSNFEREEHMKEAFMGAYRQAQRSGDSLPRVLLKFGTVHGGKWLNNMKVHTLGSFLHGFAKSNGHASFHLIAWLVNEPGTFWSLAESPAYLPVARVGSTKEWIIVDLRPIRAQSYTGKLGALSRELNDVLFAYDAVLLIGGGTRGTHRRLGAP